MCKHLPDCQSAQVFVKEETEKKRKRFSFPGESGPLTLPFGAGLFFVSLDKKVCLDLKNVSEALST